MKNRVIRILYILNFCLLFLTVDTLPGQELENLIFRNQPIEDILKVLGNAGGFTVSIDGDIRERVSFQSPSLDARVAVDLLLKENNLFSRWEGDILYVSRIRVEVDDDGLVSLDAEDAPVQELMLNLARNVDSPILFDALPNENLTIRITKRPLPEVLEVLVARFPDYSLVADDGYAYIQRRRERTGTSFGNARGTVVREEDAYALNIESARFLNVLDEMFRLANREYSYLGRNDSVLNRLTFRERPFDETLHLLLEHGNCDSVVVGDIYYIFDIQRADVLRRHNSIIRRRMEYLNVSQLREIAPPGMLPSGTMTIDKENNSLILYGTLESLAPVEDFLDLLDVPDTGRRWERYVLDFTNPSELLALLPPELALIPTSVIPNSKSLLARVADDQHQALSNWLEMMDKPKEGYPVTLRYITAKELMENLPPTFNAEDIVKTQNPNLVFFQGSRKKLRFLKESLISMDRPIPQIRYDLLVIQYQDNQEWDWGIDMSFGPGQGTSFTGKIAPLLELNFDIASTFGYQFALDLSARLSDTRAKVIADTTLNGLSGQKLSFRNTNTFRYLDTQKDNNGNVTLRSEKQITSGLFIDIEGWVSGNDMITMDIKTTISRQLSSQSNSDDTLPPTSEKTIDTHIRTEAGTPVIIGGLTQQELTTAISKTPLAGDMPLLGLLFRKENQTLENTEFVVYIIPYIELDVDYKASTAGMFEDVYEKYIKHR